MKRLSIVFLLVLVVGCASSEPTPAPDDPGPADDPEGPGSDAGDPQPVRFIVMGDVGEGSDNQYAVADAIKQKCDADGCDFALLLGDNIYDDGVHGIDDPQWEEKFEGPYRRLDMPFYPVLGNHDYGGGGNIIPMAGIGNEWHKGDLAVEYSQRSDKWTMPATHYTLRFGNVGIVMLDSNSLMWEDTTNGDQRDWYPTALSEVSGADWILVAGHHPYRSNGAHGNAGAFESIEVAGTEVEIPLPIMDGKMWKKFMDDVVCGTSDFYMSGHDHNRQWLDENEAFCGTELIVSGAGAKTKGFEDRGNEYHFQDAETPGFMWVEIDGNQFTGQFIDMNGTVDFERKLTK